MVGCPFPIAGMHTHVDERRYPVADSGKMNWRNLLSTKRIGEAGTTGSGRAESPFLLDLDRITFSAFFRRLQDKTQVHPLSEGGRVRSRLTHSIEVASVGRSLGFGVGQALMDKGVDLPQGITAHDFGYIVQAACLSHDIGNPPFGHAGEAAIAHWFEEQGAPLFQNGLTEDEIRDFTRFEGNAQGFRILNKLDYFREQGGFRMTYATLGAFAKYPGNVAENKTGVIEGKKAGFCQAEKSVFQTVAADLGLLLRGQADLWCRHPLAYLMEAADDICYRVADLEDGVTMACVSFDEVEYHLAPLAWSHKHGPTIAARREALRAQEWYQTKSEAEKLGFLRSKAIGNLTQATIDAFMRNEDALLSGTFQGELLGDTPFAEEAMACKKFAGQSIFGSARKLEIETASFEILGTLLSEYGKALLDWERAQTEGKKLSAKTSRLLAFMDVPFQVGEGRYHSLLRVTDFVSGLSDRSAVNLYKTIRGLGI